MPIFKYRCINVYLIRCSKFNPLIRSIDVLSFFINKLFINNVYTFFFYQIGYGYFLQWWGFLGLHRILYTFNIELIFMWLHHYHNILSSSTILRNILVQCISSRHYMQLMYFYNRNNMLQWHRCSYIVVFKQLKFIPVIRVKAHKQEKDEISMSNECNDWLKSNIACSQSPKLLWHCCLSKTTPLQNISFVSAYLVLWKWKKYEGITI